MAPSEKEIDNAILKAVRVMFDSDERDQLSVNSIRVKVEKSLKLGEGFLKQAAWKQRSKLAILAENKRLLDEEDEDEASDVKPSRSDEKSQPKVTKKPKDTTPSTGAKRSSSAIKSEPRKRQKKEATPESESEELSITSTLDTPDFTDDDMSDVPKSKSKKGKKPAVNPPANRGRKQKVQSKAIVGSEEDDAEEPPVKPEPKKGNKPPTKPVAKRERKAKVETKVAVKSDESDEEELQVKPESASGRRKSGTKVVAKNALDLEDSQSPDDDESDGVQHETNVKGRKSSLKDDLDEKSSGNDSESEMSVVYDEPPTRKVKSTKDSTVASSSKPVKQKAAAELTPDEAEMKTLQSQLVKCGIRKIWAFELKQYGTDNKAKIRHLKSMLKEVGMEGRFSEAKAAEIREARELAADLEAVTEGAALWGDGRSSRAKQRKSTKYEVSEEGSEEDSDSEQPVKERAARAKQDLAFLGDEESDSD